MPNPYKARQRGGPEQDTAPLPDYGYPAAVATLEVTGELAQFVTRLRILGADPGELEAVVDGWDAFDEEWTPDYRKALATAPDVELLEHLRRLRGEYRDATTTEEEAELERLIDIEETAMAQAPAAVDGSVARALEWVADEELEEVRQARAYALHLLESKRPNPRKGIIDGTASAARAWDEFMIAAEHAAGVEPDDATDDELERTDHAAVLLAMIDGAEPLERAV